MLRVSTPASTRGSGVGKSSFSSLEDTRTKPLFPSRRASRSLDAILSAGDSNGIITGAESAADVSKSSTSDSFSSRAGR